MSNLQQQLNNRADLFRRIPRHLLEEAIVVREEIQRRASRRKLLTYFPETGPLRRELYSKHCEFFTAGGNHRERLMLAANRVGKTEGVGGYELTLHLTGQYPAWWKGRRFDHAIRAWAAGDTGKTVREILQYKLLGPVGAWGTGLIPGDAISRIVRGTGGVADTVEIVYVRHASGSDSTLIFKSYDQRREAFQGTEQDVIWLDEEPELAIYTECLLRTMTNNGMIMLTFTPLLGMSDVVMQFLPDGSLPENVTEINGRFNVMATWDDAPHLSKEAKDELWKSLPPFQRDARSKGIPQLGAGAIYPVPETDLLVTPFAIPIHWPRGYGMDVGWNNTAAVWGALDRDNDILHLTHEYKRSQAEPSIHVVGIRAPGEWIPGFIDPASRGRSQRDGEQLLNDYRNLGLHLQLADNGVESGLYSVWDRMSTGRLKVFNSMAGWLNEFRLYRRDEKGHVVKSNDHLMDAMRYLESRLEWMIVKPIAKSLTTLKPVSAWS
ncbi:MAG: terminase family protein [Candidatus Acidiferrales bacterium]